MAKRLLVSLFVSCAILICATAARAQGSKELPTNLPRPLRVGVAIAVNNLAKLNEAAGTFEATLDLQLRWRDPSQAFDARETGVDRLEYGYAKAVAKAATMWTPAVSFANMPDKPQKVDPGLIINADGTITYIQRIKGVFDSKLKLSAFPFDTQQLNLQLIDATESSSQVVLVQEQVDMDDSGVRPKAVMGGWSIQPRMTFATSRFQGWNGGFYSQMDAFVSMKRSPANHLPTIIIPFALIMLVPTVLTLYVKADVAPRLTAWSGAILALVALNFTFSVRYPAMGADTFLGELIGIGFAYQLMMVCLTGTVLNPQLTRALGGEDFVAVQAESIRWLLPLGLVSLLLTRILLTALS